jgi:hypothetical protein
MWKLIYIFCKDKNFSLLSTKSSRDKAVKITGDINTCSSSFLTDWNINITIPTRKNRLISNIKDTKTILGIIMKIVFSVLLFLFSIASIASAEVIDVNIKGVDDGIKTSRQQDYQEAVMNAKLQAIERAGASIKSITKVVNFQLKYDAVESQSKAILLPGFHVVDIGYLADGTYQVMLIGKIQTSEQAKPIVGQQPTATTVGETGRDGRFIAYNNGTVLDTRTNLMWAAKDNGQDINWANAKSYCDNYRGGGYSDWRMPKQDEMAGLYDTGKTYKSGAGYDVHLTELIHLTWTSTWASETRGSESAVFNFLSGGRFWGRQSFTDSRALPVRSAK